MCISKEFLTCLKLNEQPVYKIAQQAGVNPNWLSRAINGIERVRVGGERISRVGQILGLSPEECFEKLFEAKSTKEEE